MTTSSKGPAGRQSRIELSRLLAEVAQAKTSALLLDYDGTLAPFSVARDRALPYPGVVPLLNEIMACGRTRLVIVSGRCAGEVVALLGMDSAPEVWGSHGVQRLQPDGTCETAPLGNEVIKDLAYAEKWLREEGLREIMESKPGGVAIHWRGLTERRAEEIRDRVLRGLSPFTTTASLEPMEFDGGIELRMRGIDKGHAVRTILREMGADSPIVYLGDDTTDERAFAALDGHGLSILVRPSWRTTSAQLWIKPPEELLDFLERWLRACSGVGASAITTPVSSEVGL